MVTVENEWIRDLIILLDGTKSIPEIADCLLEKDGFDLFEEEADFDFEIQEEQENIDKEAELQLKKREFLLSRLQQILQTIASQGLILS